MTDTDTNTNTDTASAEKPNAQTTAHAQDVFKRRLRALNKDLNGLPITNNMDPIILEVWMARQAASFCEAWKKEALERANAEFDTLETAERIKPGSAPTIIVHGELFGLQVTRKNPSSHLDEAKLRSALRKAGVDAAVLDTCFDEATVANKPPTSIEAVRLDFV